MQKVGVGSSANVTTDDIAVLFNNGNGTFAPPVSHGCNSTPYLTAAGDLDGDLDLDLATVNTFNDRVTVLLNQCPPPCPADIDGDGSVGVLDFLELLAAWGSCK